MPSATDSRNKSSGVRRVLSGILAANIVVVIVKFLVGVDTNSLAVFGDALQSSVDTCQQSLWPCGRPIGRQGARRGSSLWPRQVRNPRRSTHRPPARAFDFRAGPRRDRAPGHGSSHRQRVWHRTRTPGVHPGCERGGGVVRDPRRTTPSAATFSSPTHCTPAPTSSLPWACSLAWRWLGRVWPGLIRYSP